MSLLVIAYPQIEENNYAWIQSIRAKHDERYYNLVKPHFTVVFPVFDVDEQTLINHTVSVAKKFKEFYFVLRCAQIVKDSFSDYTDVFLIPEEGYRIFVRIHDELYTGPIEKNLRLDIPFIPHIGIANNLDAHKCKKLAENINYKNPEIVGSINKLDIVSFENNVVTPIKEILL